MSISLKLNSIASQHQRVISISKDEFGAKKCGVSFGGIWDYSSLGHRNPSGGLRDIYSEIIFSDMRSQVSQDSFLWIDKFKSTWSNSYESEIGAQIFVENNEFIYITQIASSKMNVDILLDIDITLWEKSETEFQTILHELKKKRKKIKKEYKILSYSISACSENNFIE